jgi:hypothetical protein
VLSDNPDHGRYRKEGKEMSVSNRGSMDGLEGEFVGSIGAGIKVGLPLHLGDDVGLDDGL